MKSASLSVGLLCVAALQAQPGSVDMTFNPTDPGFGNGDGADSQVSSMALQSDGKILIGGAFFRYNGWQSRHIARVNSGGSVDNTFTAGLTTNGDVLAMEVQPDGRILMGGWFTIYNGASRTRMARALADGSNDPSFDPGSGANATVTDVLLHPDGKILISGYLTQYNGAPVGYIARLNNDGTLDAGFNTVVGANGLVAAMVRQPDGKIVITGDFTQYNGIARNRIARLNTDGTLDAAFNPGTGTSAAITALALQDDGKVLIAGNFTSYNGTTRNRIARINNDGTLDPTFLPGSGPTYGVYTILVRPDGKILIGGFFTTYNGTARKNLARLNSDGSLDTSLQIGSGSDQEIYAIAMLTDGNLLIAGNFDTYNALTRYSLARLFPDGAYDITFNAGTGAGGEPGPFVEHVRVRSNGQILVGGRFRLFNGALRSRLAQLNNDGTLDTSFDPGSGPNDVVNCSADQPDGKVLIGGGFITVAGVSKVCVARLNADGTLDPSFSPGIGGAGAREMVLLPDGKILVVGYFSTTNGALVNRIARLLPDGSLDGSFAIGTGADASIEALALQPDGKILIGGAFTTFNGTGRNRIARLNADGSLDVTFDPGTGANDMVKELALQADGKVIIAGLFTHVNGTSKDRVARLNSTGTLEAGYNTGSGPSQDILDIALLPDDKLLIVGIFYQVGVVGSPRIARLNATGGYDATFNVGSGANEQVKCLAVQHDGGIIVGGWFTAVNGTGRNRIARLRNDATVTTTLFMSAILNGPYAAGTPPMKDDLRAASLVPATEPFTALGYQHRGGGGGETVQAGALNITGQGAIVDWVIAEVRTTANEVWMSKSALLRRDGGVVGMSGTSSISFTKPPGAYYIAIRHRNHLGVMTAAPITLSSSPTSINFTNPATPTYGTNAQKNVNGTMTLWPGDTNFNGTVKYAGSANDRDPILTLIGGTTPTSTVSNIYNGADLNMDGTVKYAGSANDRDIILQTIGGSVPTATRVAQLP
ncbi:MAG: delta-60 repeat domain-containing protein [Flavobacteriales bacterium]|nr:delta-60 repeat domain-containing protein [Flavobacteriales bacterium]